MDLFHKGITMNTLNQSSSTLTTIKKVFNHFLNPFYWRIKYKLALRHWAHHADDRSFDWDWSAINYNRIALVNLLLSKMSDPHYLEIGCATNHLFDSVHAARKVGVDPTSGGTERTTSDEFFKKNTETFDVIFIDGLHTYAQVRRDVINAIKAAKTKGWIALHDMLPCHWIEHHVPRLSPHRVWTGDVWKVAFELAQTEGIEFKILKIDHGVGVFRLLNKDATLKNLHDELHNKEFSYYYDNLQKLPIVEWQKAQEWLRS